MYTLHLVSVWMHVVAAAIWIGGMVFLALVLVPTLQHADLDATRTELIHRTGARFRRLAWVSLTVLVGTGFLNLANRGIGCSDLTNANFWRGAFGHVLLWKLILVSMVVVLSALHDFFVGPRAIAALREASQSRQARRARRGASWIGRVNLLLGLAILALAVMLVRGRPW